MNRNSLADALAALQRRDFPAAREAMRRYAASGHDYTAQHYLAQGLAELALKCWTDAAATFTDAVAHYPTRADFWHNRGMAEENSGARDAAQTSYETALTLQPDLADAAGNLSNIYRQQGRFAAAETMARRALAAGAPAGASLNALGLALAKQGRFAEADSVFQDAERHAPDDWRLRVNRANLAVDRLTFDEAWPLFAAARACSDHPLIRYHEAMARLLAGDDEGGWPLYETRLALPDALRVRPTCPRWQGQSLTGKKLLLVAEQGFGDTIQFCRYGAQLARQGAALFWMVPSPLRSWLAANLPGTVLAESDPLPEGDYWLPLLSLPFALQKLHPGDAPPAPYLAAAASPEILPAPTSAKKKIGLVWAGSPAHERDHERSIPLRDFAPLWATIPALFYAPFTGAGLEQITAATPVIRLDHALTDFAATAAVVKQLDLLITVDTAAAHVAGAIGTPTYLLLPFCPDWRWGTAGDRTAWYGSLTLLRQPRYGDWSSVIDRLVHEMIRLYTTST